MRRLELVGWLTAAVVLAGLTIPWFLWGDATIIAGLPLWLWWHIGWMGLASIVFWLFADRAWGIGIESESEPGDARGPGPGDSSGKNGSNGPSRSAAGGERR